MSVVEQLLHRYIAEYEAQGRADAHTYLAQVGGTDRAELAAHIDRYHVQAAARPFDAADFARFRADPRRQALVERILDATTLVELRAAAEVTKGALAASLAGDLGLSGHERAVKARYHDLETGATDPARVRPRVWESLAGRLGVTAERVRSAAEHAAAAFGPGPAGESFARTEVASRMQRLDPDPEPEGDAAVDAAFFLE